MHVYDVFDANFMEKGHVVNILQVCVCVCVRARAGAPAGEVDNTNNLPTIVTTSKEGKRRQYVLFMYFHRFYSKYFVLR